MPSRMERYYEAREGEPSRAKKNQELYTQIYGESEFGNKEYTAKEYTNVEGFAKTPNEGTINIQKIREMINNREDKGKPNIKELYEQIEKTDKEEVVEDNKNYDINDVLNKAKDERPTVKEENDFHSLKNVELNILKNLELNKKTLDDSKEIDSDDNKEDISQLFKTITSTSMLNKMGDKELSLDLLGDLKSNGTTMIGSTQAIKNALEESKKKEQDDGPMDKSFYTSTLKFNKLKKLYLDEGQEESENNKDSIIFRVVITILSIIALAIVVFIIFKIAN